MPPSPPSERAMERAAAVCSAFSRGSPGLDCAIARALDEARAEGLEEGAETARRLAAGCYNEDGSLGHPIEFPQAFDEVAAALRARAEEVRGHPGKSAEGN